MGFFREPYPFSEKFYLVSHKTGVKGQDKTYGIYVLDKWGNRAPLHRDPDLSCYQPMPLRPRTRPVQIAEANPPYTSEEKTGTMFVQDVYRGMTGIERGRVKYIRVMGALPWPWLEKGIFRLSYHGTVHRKKVYGVAEVHEDGSAAGREPILRRLSRAPPASAECGRRQPDGHASARPTAPAAAGRYRSTHG
jgi:hypothetical protein